MSNSRVAWLAEDDPPDSFPPLAAALRDPDGLLAAGGDLSQERLLYAYRHGIFPWYSDDQPLLWWSPDPRCVFMPGDHRVSRRLRQELRRSSAEIRVNTAFVDVIEACAAPRGFEQDTWITAEMCAAYRHLHERGWGHSIEVWDNNRLVGGLYGLAIGNAFFGESMFSRQSNASKIALLYLANRQLNNDFDILDCQVSSAHLLRLGARMIPRSEFVSRLDSACEVPQPFTHWPSKALACRKLLTK